MANHVLPRWGAVQLNNIDELELQSWVRELGQRLSAATVTRCVLLVSAVLRSAVRNKLIAFSPAEGVRPPSVRRDGSALDQIISLADLQTRLLPAAPPRHRGIIATAVGTGLRWGEVAGLLPDMVDLDNASVRVVRTIVEVAGHTSFKPCPKTTAGIRTVPLP